MRKFFLIGVIITLLLAVPLTVYILTTQKTTPQSGAAPSTVLSFNIPTDPAMVGTPIQIPVMVDPTGGSSTGNQVSFIKVVINYDGSKLQAASNYFVADQKFATVLEGPSNSCTGTKCTISATVSTGSDPNNAASSQSTVAVLTFNPLVPTDANSPTQLVFDPSSQALSIASTDKPAENVLSLNSLRPGSLTIIASNVTPTNGGGSPTDTPAPGGGGSSGGSGGGTGGSGGSGGSGGGGSSGGSSPLTCSSLTADTTTSATVPFTTMLTAVGNSTGGNITTVTFNYGDGDVENVTSGGGIGTQSISVQKSHIYKATGTFTATAVLTDDANNTTSPSACSITITVGSDQATPTPTTAPTAAPTIPATGPGSVFVGVGITGVAIAAIGLAFAVFF